MSTETPHGVWDEPLGLAVRGTLVVLPGRGERPGLYERFARRLSADAYRVRVVGDVTADWEGVVSQVKTALAQPDLVAPVVVVGSDSGALLALHLLATGVVNVDALVLAGLPEQVGGAVEDDEIQRRASCPTHQAKLRDLALLERGVLSAERIPPALREPVELGSIAVPVLALHGENDAISPLDRVRGRYAALPDAQLAIVDDGRHDVLNAAHHRSVAATVVLFLESLRAGGDLPVRQESPSDVAREGGAS
jgi:alpha-beta hydrolase superfamily lysophospholipase